VSDDRYPWYPWYVRDYRSSDRVLALTPLQRGIYRELLDVAWMKGWIPANDIIELARAARVPVSMMQRNWPAIRQLFEPLPGLDGERLTSERLERERAQVDKRRAQAAEAGRRSAAARNGRSTDVQRQSTNTSHHSTTQALVTQAAELPTPHTRPVRTAADWKRLLDKPEPRGGADVS
jgi:uncharacterized protein YdaU (DUF1376 family)